MYIILCPMLTEGIGERKQGCPRQVLIYVDLFLYPTGIHQSHTQADWPRSKSEIDKLYSENGVLVLEHKRKRCFACITRVNVVDFLPLSLSLISFLPFACFPVPTRKSGENLASEASDLLVSPYPGLPVSCTLNHKPINDDGIMLLFHTVITIRTYKGEWSNTRIQSL